jgi:hypothetical protein
MSNDEKFFTAYMLMVYEPIQYLELSIYSKDDIVGMTLPSKSNPEKDMIKKQIYDLLSNEAKEIIDVVINSPNEILSTLTKPVYNNIGKRSIKKFLRTKGWKWRVIDKAINELENYVEEINGV